MCEKIMSKPSDWTDHHPTCDIGKNIQTANSDCLLIATQLKRINSEPGKHVHDYNRHISKWRFSRNTLMENPLRTFRTQNVIS